MAVGRRTRTLRRALAAATIATACLSLSGCVALSVAGAVVGTGVAVATTAVDVGVAVGSTAISATSTVVKAVIPGD